MNRRIPLIAAVAGALVVGGAATGTTRASWTDQATMPATSVDSGRMGFSTTTPATLPALEPSGTSSATATFTVTDTSLGKNLTQRITATVTGQPAGVTATVGTSCATSQASTSVDRNPGGTATLCVRVVSSSAAVPGDVSLSLSGRQLPTGWTTATQTVTVPVAVTQPPAAAFTIRCDTQVGDNGHSFVWDAVPGATSYSIYQSTSKDGPFGAPVAVGSGLSHTVVIPGGRNATLYFQVTAVVDAMESAPSNILRIRHNGESLNMGCGAP